MNLEWAELANQIAEQLPNEIATREAEGNELREVLLLYGAFRDRLEAEKEFDEKIANLHAAAPNVGTPATRATLQIGSLTLTALDYGEAGNSIIATVTNGAASSFSVTGIDPVISEEQRKAAIEALDGTIANPSKDPALFELQQKAASLLASFSPDIKEKAGALINERWDDFRVSREGLSNPRVENGYEAMVQEADLTDSQKDDVRNTLNVRKQQDQGAAANVFTLVLTQGDISEVYPELVPGYDFPFDASQILSNIEWSGGSRPLNGTYQFEGGSNPVSPSNGRKNVKPISSYSITLDARRTFSLEQLRTIVSDTEEKARRWLAQAQ